MPDKWFVKSPVLISELRFHSFSLRHLKPETLTLKLFFTRGPIAQSVEQLAFNQWVAGSSPARLTTISFRSGSQKTSPDCGHVNGLRLLSFRP